MRKKLLYEISIIRPAVILLLVVTHALYCYRGWWPLPDGVRYNNAYWWLGYFISGFRMDTIMFVGGYVFGYQCAELGRRQPFHRFAAKKFKRLIVPALFFGTAYYLLNPMGVFSHSVVEGFCTVTDGAKHLWFLPMLFWCFLFGWAADRLIDWVRRRRPRLFRPAGWGLLAALAALSLLRLPEFHYFGLGRVNYYLFYFFFGYWLRSYAAAVGFPFGRRVSAGLPAGLWAAYAAALFFRLLVCYRHLPGMPFNRPPLLSGWNPVCANFLVFCHTLLGILAVYFTVVCWLQHRRTPEDQPSPVLRQCSRLCYGVYVFHQFYLEAILYHTALPAWCCASEAGAWLLPWAALLLTLAASVISAHLFLKTRPGRLLLG